jgi:uncharacterized protein YcbK (DUF882 family)
MRLTFKIPFAITAVVLLPAVGKSQMALLLKANSHSQLIQNRYADRDDLSRMQDSEMIDRFRRNGYLVRVPASTRHYYLRYVAPNHRYLRPWSKLFLDRLSRQYYARFKKRLRVTSVVRTVESQKSLATKNGNAASPYGARRSSHLTGATLDISKRGMSRTELDWMRRVIHSLKKKGYLYAIEEFRQPTFHIMVYRIYPEYVKGLTRTLARK